MNTGQALSQLREISDVLARTRHSTCIRPAPIACSAILAISGAGWASLSVDSMRASDASFVYYWLGIALVSTIILASDLSLRYWHSGSELQRSKTRLVIGQLGPIFWIGALSTACFLFSEVRHLHFLPGLWCVLASLGIFATLSNAPRAMLLPAMFYAVIGCFYWRYPATTIQLGPWSMGIPFGLGQASSAFILWLKLEPSKE